MDAALLQAEIDRLYVMWGVKSVRAEGGRRDGDAGTAGGGGPEELFREALAAVRAETGLSEEERKNC